MADRKRALSAGENDVCGDSLGLQDILSTNDPFTIVGRKGKKPRKENLPQSQPAASGSMNADPCVKCVLCNIKCDSKNSIQCKSCQKFHHLPCFGFKPVHFPTAILIGNLLEWSCGACWIKSNETIRVLRNEMEQVLSTLNTIKATVGLVGPTSNPLPVDSSATSSETTREEPLQRDPSTMHAYATSVSAWGANAPSQGPINSESEIKSIVMKTLKDSSRRKKNVIVSGLKESASKSDAESFVSLCRDHLNMVPRVAENGVRRLGTYDAVAPKPRRMLVRLDTDAAAADLIQRARDLRKSLVTDVSNNIFINADLSPEEAKAAYDLRVKKRSERGGRLTHDVVSSAVYVSSSRNNAYSNGYASIPSHTTVTNVTVNRSLTRGVGNCDRSLNAHVNASNLIPCTDAIVASPCIGSGNEITHQSESMDQSGSIAPTVQLSALAAPFNVTIFDSADFPGLVASTSAANATPQNDPFVEGRPAQPIT